MLRLNTFLISHFSEKARWALDFAGISYAERRLLPGPHLLVTKRLAKVSSVPILEHDARVIQGSSAIIDYLASTLGDSRLQPSAADAARSAELEALADQALGLGIQRIAYDELLKDRQAMIALWTQAGPAWARSFYALTYGPIAAATKKMYGLTSETVTLAKAQFRQAMFELDRALDAQRYFFASEGPRRIDLTVAALLAPICQPPEHVVKWPPLPDPLASFMHEFSGGPTWQHVLKMYRLHRK